jgi:hypothetical protein
MFNLSGRHGTLKNINVAMHGSFNYLRTKQSGKLRVILGPVFAPKKNQCLVKGTLSICDEATNTMCSHVYVSPNIASSYVYVPQQIKTTHTFMCLAK